jgi:hypothetical protein
MSIPCHTPLKVTALRKKNEELFDVTSEAFNSAVSATHSKFPALGLRPVLEEKGLHAKGGCHD